MWTYEQVSGALLTPDGRILRVGYSGRIPDGKNRPDKQHLRPIGPIPRGWYIIEAPRSRRSRPYYLPLTPYRGTRKNRGSAFQIHGDNESSTASTGCIVISPRSVREDIWESGDHVLRVVERSAQVTARALSGASFTAFRGSR